MVRCVQAKSTPAVLDLLAACEPPVLNKVISTNQVFLLFEM